jgi:hypothetical protein
MWRCLGFLLIVILPKKGLAIKENKKKPFQIVERA